MDEIANIDVYVLEEMEYSDETNEFGESSWHWPFVDVMGYGELSQFCFNEKLKWIEFNGEIMDSSGMRKYRVTKKKIENY